MQYPLKTFFNRAQLTIAIASLILFGSNALYAQTGYIYVHLKSINEENSTDFSFSMTGPSSYSKTFSLNDNALANNGPRTSSNAYLSVSDEGLSHGASGGDGQLWVIAAAFNATAIAGPGTAGTVYYRNPNGSQWQATSVTNAKYIDGAYVNQFVYTNSSGNVLFYNSGTTTTIYTGGNALDVTANGGRIAISTTDTLIKVYSIAYTAGSNISSGGTWATLPNHISKNVRLDMNLAGTTIAFTPTGTTNIVYTQSATATTGSPVSLGTVGISVSTYPDVAYDDNGIIYTSANNATYTDLIYHYSGGAWAAETPSRALYQLTGGVAGLVYSINLQVGAVQSIYSRQTDNSGNIYWIDDERVKNSPLLNGNGILLPVPVGTYTLIETLPSSSYDLGRYNIYAPNTSTTGNVSTRTVTVVVTAGDVVFAEFVNESLNPYSLSFAACNTTYYLQTFDASNSSPVRVTPTFGSATYGTSYSGTAFHYDSTINPQDGYYYLVKSESGGNWFSNTANLSDHTGNAGYFLVVNASYSQDEFYRQRLNNLIVGGNYQVSYYAANINPAPPALITPNVKIGIQDNTGAVIASATSGSIPSPSNPTDGTSATWYQYTLSFTATSTSTDLFLTNANTGGYGNDLAIDDITIQLLPATTPTATGIESCSSGSGIITVSAPLASGLQYSANSGTYQSSPTFSSLAAGTYTINTNYSTNPTGCASTSGSSIVIIPQSGIYGVDKNGLLYSLTTGGTVGTTAYNNSNSPSSTPIAADALGYNATTGIFYYFLNNASSYTFNSYDPTLTTSAAYTTLADPPSSSTFYMGGTTADGNGYYAIDKTGSLYYYAISSDTWTKVTAKITDATGITNLSSAISGGQFTGDITEDAFGDLWFVMSSGSLYGIYEITAPVPTTSQTSIKATQIINYLTANPAGEAWAGMAFDATGNLYMTSTTKMYKIATGSTTPVKVSGYSGSLTDLSQCALPSNPLAINWSSFTATPANGTVAVDWTVAQASSVNGFYVERSNDSKNWDTLGFVQYVNGNLSYNYNDASPLSGINYYRINEVDFDGNNNYSVIRQVEFNNSSPISLWPNPATDAVHVLYNGNAANVTVQIFDEVGRNVATSTILRGNNSIDISSLTKGLYFLVLQEDKMKTFSAKIIKNKY